MRPTGWPETLREAALVVGGYVIASAFAVSIERRLPEPKLKSANAGG